jgi:hypothetical protein
MAKPARKVTARSDAGSAFLPVPAPHIKRGTRVMLRNVKVSGGRKTDVAAYVSAIRDGLATLDTWGKTHPITVPVATLGQLARGAV